MSQPVDALRILHECFPYVDSDDPVSYFSEAGDAVQALKYSWSYWPNLVEIHVAVFLALSGNDENEIVERLATPLADQHPEWPTMSWTQIINSYNIFEIQHLFRQQRGPAEFAEETHRELGRILLQTWHARLATSYPERRFVVQILEADDSMDLRIEVSQESTPLTPPKGWDERRRGIIIDS
jgi:hypothetical protein